MDHIEGHSLIGHYPEPLQGVETVPGSFINIVDWSLPRLPRNRYVVGGERLRQPVQDLLDGTQTDRDLQHGGTKRLHETAAVPVRPREFPYEGTEPRAVACGMFGRHLGGGPATTVHTPALMHYPVRHVHRDRGQLNDLMRIRGRGQGKPGVSTRTSLRSQLPDSRRRQQDLAMSLMPWFPARFAGRC